MLKNKNKIKNVLADDKICSADDMARFKYAVIAPALHLESNGLSLTSFFIETSKHLYCLPNGQKRFFSIQTIRGWYYKYREASFDSLYRRKRSDAGISRAIPEEIENKIFEILEMNPDVSTSYLIEQLKRESFESAVPAKNTIYRWRENHENLIKEKKQQTKRIPFVFPAANDCWQADTTIIKIGIAGVCKNAYIVVMLDDHSRYITNIEAFLNDNTKNMLKTFKGAIIRAGVPRRLFVDNGTPYKNAQIERICALLGINLIHATPYSCQSKGKVERFNSTLKNTFLHHIDLSKYKTLEEFNDVLKKFVFDIYNKRKHSQLPTNPLLEFSKFDVDIKRVNESLLDDSFTIEYKRRVRSDNTIHIDKVQYLVPYGYTNKKITISEELNGGLFIHTDKNKIQLQVVDKTFNSAIKRGGKPFKEEIDLKKVIEKKKKNQERINRNIRLSTSGGN